MVNCYSKIIAFNVQKFCVIGTFFTFSVTMKEFDLTVKWLGESIWSPSCGFSKSVSSGEKVKAWIFVTFNIFISQIFRENFIEILQVVQKIWRFSPSILHYVESVQIRSFFWSVFSPNAGKYGPEKTPYLDTFHTVLTIFINFSDFLTFPYYKKTNDVNILQMMSAFFTFNLL